MPATPVTKPTAASASVRWAIRPMAVGGSMPTPRRWSLGSTKRAVALAAARRRRREARRWLRLGRDSGCLDERRDRRDYPDLWRASRVPSGRYEPLKEVVFPARARQRTQLR